MYQPLNREDGETRLIRFNLESLDGNDPRAPREGGDLLSLRLEHHRHGEMLHKYTALSYAWGDPDDQVTILVNDVEVSVRQNLHRALSELRRRRTEAWLWVDAICIDQANDDEKSWEVDRMRDIFRQADTVYHWLGPAADDSDFFLDWAAAFGREAYEAGVLDFVDMDPFTQQECFVHFVGDKYPDIVSGTVFDTPTEPPDANESITTHGAVPLLVQFAIQVPPDQSAARINTAMETLLQRQFFQRLWIVQELAVSRKGVFLCGSRQLPVDHFESIVAVADHGLWNMPLPILEGLRTKAGPAATQSRRERRLGGLNGNLFKLPGFMARRTCKRGVFPSLLSILTRCMFPTDMPILAAADPRDTVFGLLGVSHDTELLGIRADYSKSTTQVFTELTRALIRRDKEYLLGFSTFPKDLAGLPSWVPDWPRMSRGGIGFYPVSFGLPQYNASLDSQQPPEHSVGEAEGSPVLLLSGFYLGSITSTFAPHVRVTRWDGISQFCHENGITDNDVVIRTCIMDDVSLGGLCGRTDSEFLGLAKRVLRGQKRIQAQDCTPKQVRLLSRYHEVLLACGWEEEQGGDRGPLIQRQFALFSQHLLDGVANRFGEYSGTERSLFVTDKGGSRLGFGPSHVQRGDVVVILFGYTVPMVLRPVENGMYSFVGEVYLDGVMDGEAMKEGEIHTEDFQLV